MSVDLSVEEILRRLLLLGLPLVPLGCESSNASREIRDGATVEVGLAGGGGRAEGGAGGMAGGGGAGDMGGMGGGAVGPPWCPPPTVVNWSSTRTSWADKAAWDKCFVSGDCGDLCKEIVVAQLSIYGGTCERTDPPPAADGGVDARDAASTDAVVDASDAEDAASQPPLKVRVTIYGMPCGRRPAGMERVRASSRGSAAGRYLARAAALEAASVPAFRRLARELTAHGAPTRLIEAAHAAVAEEARHYALMAEAARARGAEPRRPRVRPMPVRSLLEIARENARQGCVRETFGAMTAVIQARRVLEPRLRAAMASIARDESRHARLSWEVDAWARAILGERHARAVVEARRSEGARLLAELARARTPSGIVKELGLPTDATSRRRALRAQRLLWGA